MSGCSLSFVDKSFSQQCDVNNRHLETRLVDGRWQWFISENDHLIAAGNADSLEQAKEIAELAACGTAEWRTVAKDPLKKPER
jgi:hypothetical protein